MEAMKKILEFGKQIADMRCQLLWLPTVVLRQGTYCRDCGTDEGEVHGEIHALDFRGHHVPWDMVSFINHLGYSIIYGEDGTVSFSPAQDNKSEFTPEESTKAWKAWAARQYDGWVVRDSFAVRPV